jgi:hypothetical protein
VKYLLSVIPSQHLKIPSGSYGFLKVVSPQVLPPTAVAISFVCAQELLVLRVILKRSSSVGKIVGEEQQSWPCPSFAMLKKWVAQTIGVVQVPQGPALALGPSREKPKSPPSRLPTKKRKSDVFI